MKGILFKPDMIKATIEDRKTVTRRLSGLKEINKEPDNWHFIGILRGEGYAFGHNQHAVYETIKPRYQVGDTVYIKEAWADMVCLASTEKGKGKGESNPIYKSTADSTELKILAGHWKSPMFMPEWAARYFIGIVSVRAERLQEITEADAVREGCKGSPLGEPLRARLEYQSLWDSINDKIRPEEREFTLDDKSNKHFVKGQCSPHSWASNPWCWRYEFERVKL